MAYNKVVYGTTVLVDLTEDTVDADNLAYGETAHDKAGNEIVGVLPKVNIDEYVRIEDQNLIILYTTFPTSSTYQFKRLGETSILTYSEIVEIFSNQSIALSIDGTGIALGVVSGVSSSKCQCIICLGNSYVEYTFKSDGTYSKTIKSLQEAISSSNKIPYSNISGAPDAVTESTVSGWGFTKNAGTYSKPSGGIPKSDLESDVQTSLGKADSAVQAVKTLHNKSLTGTGNVTLTASDVGAAGTSHQHGGFNNLLEFIRTPTEPYNGCFLPIIDDDMALWGSTTMFDGSTKTKALTPSGTWETFYQKPSDGIIKSDLASDVQTSLGKADSAVTSVKINGTSHSPTSGEVDLGTIGGGTGGDITQAEYDALVAKLATIEQSADRVIASGGSGDWTYKKWSSGLMECWCHLTTTQAMNSSSAGGYRIATSLTVSDYPVTFVEVPVVVPSCMCVGDLTAFAFVTKASNPTVNVGEIAIWRGNSSSNTTVKHVYVTVRGRWK